MRLLQVELIWSQIIVSAFNLRKTDYCAIATETNIRITTWKRKQWWGRFVIFLSYDFFFLVSSSTSRAVVVVWVFVLIDSREQHDQEQHCDLVDSCCLSEQELSGDSQSVGSSWLVVPWEAYLLHCGRPMTRGFPSELYVPCEGYLLHCSSPRLVRQLESHTENYCGHACSKRRNNTPSWKWLI